MTVGSNMKSSSSATVPSQLDRLAKLSGSVVRKSHHHQGRGMALTIVPAVSAGELRISYRASTPLYEGKAQKSLVGRDMRDHFAVGSDAPARTGSLVGMHPRREPKICLGLEPVVRESLEGKRKDRYAACGVVSRIEKNNQNQDLRSRSPNREE